MLVGSFGKHLERLCLQQMVALKGKGRLHSIKVCYCLCRIGIMDAVQYSTRPDVIVSENATLGLGFTLHVQYPPSCKCYYTMDGSDPSYYSQRLQGEYTDERGWPLPSPPALPYLLDASIQLDREGLWHLKFIAISSARSEESPIEERTFLVMPNWGCVIKPRTQYEEIEASDVVLDLRYDKPRFSIVGNQVQIFSGDGPDLIKVNNVNVARVIFGDFEPSVTVLEGERIRMSSSPEILPANTVIPLSRAHTVLIIDDSEYHFLIYGLDCPLWDDIVHEHTTKLLCQLYGDEYRFHPRSRGAPRPARQVQMAGR